MITITWIKNRCVIFDKTHQKGWGYLSLLLFGKTQLDMPLYSFDMLEFVELKDNKLVRILYGI